MNKKGPIIIIEDDSDDRELMEEIYKDLGFENELIFCTDGEKALDYLIKTPIEPFIILSDINMPKLNGMELREQVHNNEDLRVKCIPYLFFSTSVSQNAVIDAYSLSVQGFFKKEHSIVELEKTIHVIMEYWKRCAAPNNF